MYKNTSLVNPLLDFAAWGFTKKNKSLLLKDELKERIQLSVQEITSEMLQNAFRNVKDRFEIC